MQAAASRRPRGSCLDETGGNNDPLIEPASYDQVPGMWQFGRNDELARTPSSGR
jgi:hypothetical protein